ncbi:hypothetical protein [Streptomyces chitinivorans]|uniref:hypothetical protein n=1 Tax=Streptomyces chitinivorans TaxID=1257027 RepID=UPI00244A14AA|nr:hypothetical protein [Streptomyces chitinivorans]MDH2409713.1 hypothetical protein [Streptomyces chitinivorans]
MTDQQYPPGQPYGSQPGPYGHEYGREHDHGRGPSGPTGPAYGGYDAYGGYGGQEAYAEHGGQDRYGRYRQHEQYQQYDQHGRYAAPGQEPYGAPAPPHHPGPGPLPPERGGTAGAPGAAAAAPTATAAATAAAPATAPAATAGSAAGAPRRTGSPIIAPGLTPAALTALLAVLLAATAQLSRPVSAVAVVLLQAVTAAGWFRLNGMWPARQGIALAFLAGVTADIALLALGVEHASAVVIGTLGAWVLLVLVLQLRNHSSPDERLYALTAGVTSTALAVLATGHLAAEPDAVTTGALAVAAAALVRALPLPQVFSVVVSLSAAAGAGAAAGQFTSLGGSGAVLGVAAGVCGLIGLRVASYDFPSRFVHMTAGVALPLTAAVPAVYLLGRALA